VLIFVSGVLWIATTSQRFSTTLTYSQFLEKARTGQIAGVIVMGSSSGAIQAICRLKDGSAERTILPSDCRDAMAAMQDKLVDVEIRDASFWPLHLVMPTAPFLVLFGVWIFRVIHKFPNGPGQSIFPWLSSPRH
jgi:ATP-dependent Zn protease